MPRRLELWKVTDHLGSPRSLCRELERTYQKIKYIYPALSSSEIRTFTRDFGSREDTAAECVGHLCRVFFEGERPLSGPEDSTVAGGKLPARELCNYYLNLAKWSSFITAIYRSVNHEEATSYWYMKAEQYFDRHIDMIYYDADILLNQLKKISSGYIELHPDKVGHVTNLESYMPVSSVEYCLSITGRAYIDREVNNKRETFIEGIRRAEVSFIRKTEQPG